MAMDEPATEGPLAEFGFEDHGEAWLGQLAGALAPAEMGAIGEFDVLGEVARGGQGVVWRARQLGTGRVIAIKRLLEGRSATASARRRFEREVEAAARLRHPGIVSVLGFEVRDGAPLLALEWIDGRPIDAWGRELAGEGRLCAVLGCLLRVGEAVEHAHAHGVLHLDLKPSNILVDEDDQPVVLDFGLARVDASTETRVDASAVTRVDASTVSVTRAGSFLGTLAYASPEQLRGARSSLDARSDVYSLGVLIYELVCGERPFAFEGGVAQALAQQEGEQFERPSRRIAEGSRLLRRELDAISMRALRFEAADRYASIGALTEDLRRLLDGRPVLAHPPSLVYEMRKAARAHRGAFAAGGLLLLSLLAFGLHSARQARLLERERQREGLARQAAEEAEARAVEEARGRADLLQFLLGELFEEGRMMDPNVDLSLRQLLDEASARAAERFADQPVIEAELRGTLGCVYRTIGLAQAAAPEFERALELAPDASELQAVLLLEAGVNETARGEFGSSLELLGRALERRHQLGPPLELKLLNEYGTTLVLFGRPTEAEVLAREALALARVHGDGFREVKSLQRLGLALAKQGRFEAAIEPYRAGLELARELRPEGDVVAGTASFLGDLEQALGRLDEAAEHAEEALRIHALRYPPEHPVIVAALGDVGEVASESGRLGRASEWLDQAVEGSIQTRGTDSRVTDIHRLRAATNRLRAGAAAEIADELVDLHERFSTAGPPLAVWERKAADVVLALQLIERFGSAAPDPWPDPASASPNPGFAQANARLLAAQNAHSRELRELARDLLAGTFDQLERERDNPPLQVQAFFRRTAVFFRTRGDEDLSLWVEQRAAAHAPPE